MAKGMTPVEMNIMNELCKNEIEREKQKQKSFREEINRLSSSKKKPSQHIPPTDVPIKVECFVKETVKKMSEEGIDVRYVPMYYNDDIPHPKYYANYETFRKAQPKGSVLCKDLGELTLFDLEAIKWE